MARYIDADMLLADILDERIVNKSENAQIALRHFERMVNRTPTADVAPRAEVAREIIIEIADFMWQGESEKLNISFNDRFYNKQEFIAELEKKYQIESTEL